MKANQRHKMFGEPKDEAAAVAITDSFIKTHPWIVVIGDTNEERAEAYFSNSGAAMRTAGFLTGPNGPLGLRGKGRKVVGPHGEVLGNTAISKLDLIQPDADGKVGA